MEFELRVHLIDRRIVQIGLRNRAFDVLSDVEGTSGSMFCPPTQEAIVVGAGVSDGPVELRHDVVHPTLADPEQDVGIQVVVVLQTAGVATGHTTAGRQVVVNAEGRHTEFDPRFDAVHGVVEHLDEGIHVVATPIRAVVESIAVGGEGGIVGDGKPGTG